MLAIHVSTVARSSGGLHISDLTLVIQSIVAGGFSKCLIQILGCDEAAMKEASYLSREGIVIYHKDEGTVTYQLKEPLFCSMELTHRSLLVHSRGSAVQWRSHSITCPIIYRPAGLMDCSLERRSRSLEYGVLPCSSLH